MCNVTVLLSIAESHFHCRGESQLLNLLGDYVLQQLPQDPHGSLSQRLFRCLHGAIVNGVLPSKTRLPASRDLAKQIGVSRNTVLNVYEQLQAEGYLYAQTGHGTWVCEQLPEQFLNSTHTQISPPTTPQPPIRLSQRGSSVLAQASASPHQWGAFVPGTPDVTEFPHQILTRIMTRLSRQPDINALIYNNAAGCLELRQALAGHLKVSRSVHCDPDQIIITDGIHQAIDLVSRVLSDVGDQVWIEDPSYWGLRNILHLNGLQIRPLAVDQDGMLPSECSETTQQKPRLIFVTPSHQYPLGAHLSLPRRTQLLALARRMGSWIVEDDYDSEFRFADDPYPALQGLEPDAPVIYTGTFSKTIYPALRMGYLVAPKAIAQALRVVSAELYRGGHALMQLALAEFIQQGHYQAHIRRMRLLYAKRHDLLKDLITRYLGPSFLHEYHSDAGLHLILKLPQHCDDVQISQLLAQQEIHARPLSTYYIQPETHAQKGLLLGFACVQEQQMSGAFGVLRQTLLDAGVIV